ncbi:hypothetical protein [Paracoccus sp. J55]|uniref:hypothetical protein n=1 Tax=Paracoccus sp. J55 TaxID=935849 RepID=UPI00048D3EED|nr:hypothetical protein [Paracoccus sp. J55]
MMQDRDSQPGKPGAAAGALADLASIHLDPCVAPPGPLSGLTARGAWRAALAECALAGGAPGRMTAEGLEMRGNILRWTGRRGPAARVTLLADATRHGVLGTGRATLLAINPHLPACALLLQYDRRGLRVIGPGGLQMLLAPIGGFGDRQTVGCELDLAEGRLSVVEADGETRQSPLQVPAFAVERVEIGRACLGVLHAAAVIVE